MILIQSFTTLNRGREYKSQMGKSRGGKYMALKSPQFLPKKKKEKKKRSLAHKGKGQHFGDSGTFQLKTILPHGWQEKHHVHGTKLRFYFAARYSWRIKILRCTSQSSIVTQRKFTTFGLPYHVWILPQYAILTLLNGPYVR